MEIFEARKPRALLNILILLRDYTKLNNSIVKLYFEVRIKTNIERCSSAF